MKKDDKARVRVFFGEIEGDNESIREGFRSIAQAVNRTFQPEIRIIKVLGAGNGVDQKLAEELQREVIDAELAENEGELEETIESSEKSKGRTNRQRKFPAYSFVNDLNLRPEGKPSLREFYEEKKPADNQQLLTVIVYYLHRVLGTESVSVNHVYTSLKGLSDLGVRVPPDIPNILRKTSNRKGWLDSSDSDNLRTTVPGDNFVEQDLPRAKSQAASA